MKVLKKNEECGKLCEMSLNDTLNWKTWPSQKTSYQFNESEQEGFVYSNM